MKRENAYQQNDKASGIKKQNLVPSKRKNKTKMLTFVKQHHCSKCLSARCYCMERSQNTNTLNQEHFFYYRARGQLFSVALYERQKRAIDTYDLYQIQGSSMFQQHT